MMNLTKDQLEMQLRYAETELQVWIKHLTAHKERGESERRLIEAAWFMVGGNSPLLATYTEAHKADYDAKADLIQMNLARLQSNVDNIKQGLESFGPSSKILA
jgi:hypothetical protein